MRKQIEYVEMQREVGVLKTDSQFPKRIEAENKNAEYIPKFIFIKVNSYICFKFHGYCFPTDSIHTKAAMFHIMAWGQRDDKPLSEPKVI